ncbi:MAG: tripartite tricarboxylate transporter TctB family protein [Pseudomonadota bacterium]
MWRDLVCGVLGLALAAAYYAGAAAVPVSLLTDAVGADGVPRMLAISLGTLSAALLVRAMVAREAVGGEETPEAGGALRYARALGLVALGFLYVGVAPYLGYPLALALLLAATVVYYGLPPNLRLVPIAVAGAALFWVLFVKMLGVPMPVGVWPRILG